MKNKYFGDIRDLFKYDIIKEIMIGVRSLQKFTFIPMLTKDDDGKRDGNERDFDKAEKNFRPGTKNEKLMKFLSEYREIKADKRNFRDIRQYFQLKQINVKIYEENSNGGYFDRKSRASYFKKIDDKLLSNSLIFVDPDIGLEIKRSSEKHLLCHEVRDLYKRMDENSILMIYQHFPRENHEKYLVRRSRELKEITENLPPIYISDNEIILFLLTQTSTMRTDLAKIITEYKESYKNYEKLIVDIK